MPPNVGDPQRPAWIRSLVPGAPPGGALWFVCHGWDQSPWFWRPVARWLAADRVHLLGVDAAHLASTVDAPRASRERLEAMAGAVLAATATPSARPDVLVGHSAGCVLALAVATELRPRTLVLVEPLPHLLGLSTPPAPRTRGNRQPTGATRERAVPPRERLARTYPLADPEVLDVIAAAERAWQPAPPRPAGPRPGPEAEDRLRAARAALVREMLAAVSCPVLVVRGRLSSFTTPAGMEQVLDAAGGHGRLVEIPRAGHSPHVDDPRGTAAALAAFAAAPASTAGRPGSEAG